MSIKKLINNSLQSIFIISLSLLHLHAKSDKMYTVSLSNYSAKATELVYTSSKKLSELIWMVEDAKLLGVSISTTNNKNIILSGSIKKNISTENGVMDDYDWLFNTSDWSHWSHHEDTDLTDITILHLLVEKKLHNGFSIAFGYNFERTKWIASNGFYIYSSDPGFRDLTGTFNGKGITYIQEFTSIFTTLAYTKELEDLSYTISFSRSLNASAKDYDTHHMRNIQFDSVFQIVTYNALSAMFEYYLNEDTDLFFSYEYKAYDEASGMTHYTDLSTGEQALYSGAGIANRYSLLTLGLNFRF